MAAFNSLMAPAPDDFWFQFNPENASGNSPLNGGGGFTGGRMPGELVATGQPVPAQGGAWDPANVNRFRDAWMASGGRTTEDLRRFVEANPQYGAQVTGSKGSKILFPGMQAFQAVRSAGLGGGIGAAWDDITGHQEAGVGQGDAGGSMPFGSLIAPFTERYTLPSMAELQQMPGYQAAQDAAMEATQRSAAAKGTLLTGGTQRALQQNAGDVASQMYGQLAGLGMNAFGINRDSFWHNQDAPFSKLYNTSQLGLNAAQSAANTGSGYANAMSNLYTNQGNSNAAGTVANANQNSNTIGSLVNAGMDIYNKYRKK
jgi:hypothetical protein